MGYPIIYYVLLLVIIRSLKRRLQVNQEILKWVDSQEYRGYRCTGFQWDRRAFPTLPRSVATRPCIVGATLVVAMEKLADHWKKDHEVALTL